MGLERGEERRDDEKLKRGMKVNWRINGLMGRRAGVKRGQTERWMERVVVI